MLIPQENVVQLTLTRIFESIYELCSLMRCEMSPLCLIMRPSLCLRHIQHYHYYHYCYRPAAPSVGTASKSTLEYRGTQFVMNFPFISSQQTKRILSRPSLKNVNPVCSIKVV